MAKFLVEEGAKVNQADNEGKTPLWIAAAVCHFSSLIPKKIKHEL